MAKKKSHEDFIADFKNLQPELFSECNINSEYVNNSTPININCKICQISYNRNPSLLLNGSKCINCRRLTKNVIDQRLSVTHQGWTFNIDYTKSVQQKVEYVCGKGHTGASKLRKLLEGNTCKTCLSDSQRKPEILTQHLMKFKNVTLVSEYIDQRVPLLFNCTRHGHFTRSVSNMLSKDTACPICSRDNFRFHNKTLAERNKEPYLQLISNVYLINIVGVGYKVGISKSPDSRFNLIKKQSGKEIEVLKVSQSNLYNCILLEDYILNNFDRKDVPYTFDGYREVLDITDTSEIILLMDTLT